MNSASSTSVFRWQPSCWLAVRGSDAATFLQGQFTNELRGARGGVYGLWLNTKGKVLADSFVIPAGDGAYRICSYHSPAAVVRERLESHIIADDVELSDETAEVSAVTLIGTSAADVATRLIETAGATSFAGHRLGEEHLEVVFPNAAAGEIDREIAALPTLPAAEIEWRRIASGTPAIPQDIGPNDLPNEGGLEVDAISFTKGCYLGQEVMARLKNLGQVRRKLLRVRSDVDSPPSLPAALFAGERVVGELRSAVVHAGRLHGLALLTLMHVQPGAVLSFSPGGPAPVEITEKP